MALLFIILAALELYMGPQFVLFPALGIACAQIVSLGLTGAVRRAYAFAISDAQKRGVTTAALVMWAVSSVILCSLGFGMYTWLGQINWLWAAVGGALWIFDALGVGLCAAADRRVVWGISLGLSVSGFAASALTADDNMRLIILAASLCVPGLLGWAFAGKLGRFSAADLKRLLAYGRPMWFVWIFGGLPLAWLAWRYPEVASVYLLSAAWMEYAVYFARLDDHGSERHLALGVLLLSLPLAAAPWAREWLAIPPWFMLMPVWAVSVAHVPVIGGRVARYAWVATPFLLIAACGCFLPVPQGGAVALVSLALMYMILRPCMYAFWLPLRARFLHKKRHGTGKNKGAGRADRAL